MAEITDHVDDTGRLTTHVVVGKASLDDILRAMAAFNTEERATLNSLWDFGEASLVDIRAEELKRIIGRWKELRHLREGGRTALLVQRALELGVVRMFQAHLEIENVTDQFAVFRDREDALDWLEESE